VPRPPPGTALVETTPAAHPAGVLSHPGVLVPSQPDPHAELGVPPDATSAEIHRAFRRRLRENHPDTRTGAVDPESDRALQRILEAYAMLRRQPSPAPPVQSSAAMEVPVRDARGPAPGQEGLPLRVTPIRWTPARGTTRRDTFGDAATDDRLTAERVINWLLGR